MKEVLKNSGLYVGAYEYSRVLNSIELSAEADLPEVTTFGAASREFLKGLKGVRFAAAGFFDPLKDASLHDEWESDSIDQVLTAAHRNEVGGVAYFMRGCIANYGFGAPMGQAATITLSGQTTAAPVVRGKVLARQTAVTATGNGTPIEFPEVGAAQGIYAALHVFAASGTTPSLTVKIQSDDAEAFTDPVDRLTFAAATGIVSEWKGASPGALTDTWWRAVWTISGSSPSFGFVASFGIA